MSEIASTLSRFIRAMHAARAQYVEQTGIERGGSYLLAHLAQAGDLRLTTLAEHLSVDPALVSRQSKALIDQGLIERVPDQGDGRASLLRITSAGREFVAANEDFKCRFFNSVFADWSEREREQFEVLLARFTDDFCQSMAELKNVAPTQSSHKNHKEGKSA